MAATQAQKQQAQLATLVLPEDKFELTDPYLEAAARVTQDVERATVEKTLREESETFDAIAREKLQRVIPHLEAIVDKLALGGEADFSGTTKTVLDHVQWRGARYYPGSDLKTIFEHADIYHQTMYSEITVDFSAGTLTAEYRTHRGHYFHEDPTTQLRVTIGGREGSIAYYQPRTSLVGRTGSRIGIAATAVLGSSAGAFLVFGGEAMYGLTAITMSLGVLIGVPSICTAVGDYFGRRRREVPLARITDVVVDAEDRYAMLRFLYALPAAIEEVYRTARSKPAEQQEAAIRKAEEAAGRMHARANDARELTL